MACVYSFPKAYLNYSTCNVPFWQYSSFQQPLHLEVIFQVYIDAMFHYHYTDTHQCYNTFPFDLYINSYYLVRHHILSHRILVHQKMYLFLQHLSLEPLAHLEQCQGKYLYQFFHFVTLLSNVFLHSHL